MNGPVFVPVPLAAAWLAADSGVHLLLASSEQRLLAFDLSELKVMAKGRGLQLMNLADGSHLAHVLVTAAARFVVSSQGKRGGEYRDILRVQDIRHKRGHKGKPLNLSGSLSGLAEADGD